MGYFFSKARPYIGMLISDIVILGVWVLSLQWTFAQFDAMWMTVLSNVLMTLFLILNMWVRYHTIYRRYGIDDVTGGKTKREFERIANDLLKTKDNYVIVYANIDRFKLLNDMYGAQIGDRILRKVHTVIDEELRWDEVSGRTMADNYGILMRYHSVKKLDERLYRINRQLLDERDDSGASYGIVLTFGVYLVRDFELSVESMLERAHLAGGNLSTSYLVPLGIYDENARKKLGRERELELKMKQALANKEFVPFLQPKYQLSNEKVAGAEALVRWIDPIEGMIYPNDFIPLFEKNGFVVQLDLYMFEEVCKLIERWESAGCIPIPISVNLSRANFSVPNFFEEYKKIVKKYHVPTGTIEFEFTESLLYNNLDELNHLVNQIHELGFLCSIDDFGSGYSSLNMLKDVNVDVLKLDRVFFSEGDNSSRGQDVIRSVITLAKALNLKTVSEGIELVEQVNSLRDMGCDYVQGYVFAKPMSVDEFEKLVYMT